MNKQPTRLLSAPNEDYQSHINKAIKNWSALQDRLSAPLRRTVNNMCGSSLDPQTLISDMIMFHDLGKLTRLWQQRIAELPSKKTPPHAAIGAAYLSMSRNSDCYNPAIFAILIHHTDSGVVSDGLENPDGMALRNGIINDEGFIRWHDFVKNLPGGLFPEDAFSLNLDHLRKMSRELRRWSRSGAMVQMHSRRMAASLFHHILRLCDVRAAAIRGDFAIDNRFVHAIVHGGLLA